MGGIRRVTVVGTGLIGTSMGLALCARGVAVALTDREPMAQRDAVARGAGVPWEPSTPPADLVLICVPPSEIGAALRDAQTRGLGTLYTDVAGVKEAVVLDAVRAGCDLTTWVPGHPMAGSERSGPHGARADLFHGATWVFCPVGSSPDLATVTECARLVGARPTILEPRVHDSAVALSSHLPHLVSAALAAAFRTADAPPLAVAGRGLRDTTRIAAGDVGLWSQLLRLNARSVTAALDSLIEELQSAAYQLRSATDTMAVDDLSELLTRGNAGRERIVSAVEQLREF